MKITKNYRQSVAALLSVIILVVPSVTFALKVSASTSSNSTNSAQAAAQTALQQQHLANVKSKGDAEINRRLAQLNKLGGVINAAVHLTSSDNSTLSSEVNTETSGLGALETQLNGETVLANAITDAQNIYSEYRVYALVTPKVWLIKTADDQQSVEAQLSSLAAKLQTRINADQTAGKNVTTLLNTLSSMNSEISSTQSISSSTEAAVLPLQPSDYDSDHSILSGYASSLQTAHKDNVTAYDDAQSIVTGIKDL